MTAEIEKKIRWMAKPLIDKLFFVVLVLNATGLYRFVAPQLSVTIGQVSAVLLIVNALYFLARLPQLTSVLPRMLPWFAVLIAWPLVTLFYAPAIELREIGLAVYGFSLFAGTVAYILARGLPAARQVFLISFFLTVFGLFLNLLLPGYFIDVALLADARVLSLGRPGGFYMQPNSLAIGMAIIFTGWLALVDRKKYFLELTVIILFLVCEFLTGSRTGMLLGIMVVGLDMVYRWMRNLFDFHKRGYFSTRIALLAVCIFLVLGGAKFLVGTYGKQVGYESGGLIDRMSTLIEFKLTRSESLLQDASLYERLDAQRVYVDLIREKPILGHGLGTEANYVRTGDIYRTSHSELLSMAMEYGISAPFVFLLLIFAQLFSRYRKPIEKFLGTNTIWQFTLLIAITFIAAGGLLDRRVFFMTLGVVFVLVNFPWKVIDWNASTRTWSRMLNGEELQKARRIRKWRLSPKFARGPDPEVLTDPGGSA